MNHTVFIIVCGDGKVTITDVKHEAMECVKDLAYALTPFKFIVYNTESDYIIRA